MMYVIRRNEDGKYVTKPESKHTYTRRLEDARVFRSREAAEWHACGNEQVMTVEEMVKG